MTNIKINGWKDSASESWSMNEKSVKKSGVLYFFITIEQKEYLENHINLIDEWCKSNAGKETVSIRFQEDWDEYDGETSYICECYFDDDDIVVNPNVDTVEGLMDVYHKKGYDFSVGAKKHPNGNEVELYTIGSDWNPKFYIKISSKDGGEITDDVIKSHVEIFYEWFQ